MFSGILDVGAVRDDLASGASLLILLTREASEAPLAGDDDLLLTRELELAAAKSLNDHSLVGILRANGHQDLANVDACHSTGGLTKSATHTGLETIRTGARKHFVDADDVEGVHTNTHMEAILTTHLADILVGTDTGCLQSLTGELLTFQGNQMDTERELVHSGLLATQVIDTNLGVGNTTAEARLGIRLVSAVTIAASRTATHLWMDEWDWGRRGSYLESSQSAI